MRRNLTKTWLSSFLEKYLSNPRRKNCGERVPAQDYIPVGIFVIIGILIPVISLTISRLFRPVKPSEEKLRTYECGEIPTGEAWQQFNIQYYLFAIMFVIFDVEIIYLYPWATIFTHPTLGFVPFIEMMIFISVLIVGLIYAWRKGALEWV